MDTKHQFTAFCLCVGVGIAGGVLYEIVALFRGIAGCNKGKNKVLGIVLDVLFCLGFATLGIAASYTFHFPSFRVYMLLGYALGGGLYLKTLHRIVAFFKKVCYNKITQVVKKVKKQEKTLQKEVDI